MPELSEAHSGTLQWPHFSVFTLGQAGLGINTFRTIVRSLNIPVSNICEPRLNIESNPDAGESRDALE